MNVMTVTRASQHASVGRCEKRLRNDVWKAHEGKVRHVAYIVDMSAERNGLVVTGASGFASQSCSKAWYGSVLPRRLAGSVTVRFSV